MSKRLLLINPWIYDFTAHDLWIKPLGLLQLAAILEKNGYRINFIDCLDRYHPELLKLQKRRSPRGKKYGCGKYFKEILEKPAPLEKIPRLYGRYGLPPDIFCRELRRIPAPDAVLVTSGMTYWYPGVFETIRLTRKEFPRAPIILGGIYASLCTEHARKYSGADVVIPGADVCRIIPAIIQLAGMPPSKSSAWIPANLDELPYPAYHLLSKNAYVCLRTSRSCPFSCNYCASSLLHPHFEQQQPNRVITEIDHFHRRLRIRNFAFYDDALLVNAEQHLHPILDGIIERSIKANFHTPNALHAKYITQELARKLYRAGFKTIRLGLETANPSRQNDSGGKVNNTELKTAVANLRQAGYKQTEIGVYILMGLPEEPLEEILNSVAFVLACGAKPVLTEYSPLPGTKLWEKYRSLYSSAVDEPLWHNNSLLGYYPQTRPDLLELKYLVKTLNFGLQQGINLFDNTRVSKRFRDMLRKYT
jgi:radical SAM superfamily enzyme YgiQ (UPF0313 family)